MSHKIFFPLLALLAFIFIGGFFLWQLSLSNQSNSPPTKLNIPAITLSQENSQVVYAGEDLTVLIAVNSFDRLINVIELEATYPPDCLEVFKLDIADSFVKIWFEKSWSKEDGIIRLTGGLPSPQSPVNGNVARVILKPLKTGSCPINLTANTHLFENANSQAIPFVAQTLTIESQEKQQ